MRSEEEEEDLFGREYFGLLMELIGDNWNDIERFMEERSRWKTNGRSFVREIGWKEGGWKSVKENNNNN